MRIKRIEPGRYELWDGRGQNKRTFEVRKVEADDPDGYCPGWLTIETDIFFLTIESGYSLIAQGLKDKKAAVAAAEAEL